MVNSIYRKEVELIACENSVIGQHALTNVRLAFC